MTFLAPWLLLGTLLAGVPLAIHLLNKPRYRKHPWGAMMFLQAAVERRSRSIKLQQLILLIIRMLILALLAWALARPVLSSGSFPGGDQPTTHVLILDGSYSMRQGQNKDNAFKKMIGQAKKIVETMKDRDNAIFIWAGNKPRALTSRPVFNRTDLNRILEGLEPGWEKADIPKAVEHAMWMLPLSTLPAHRIYILSDLQQSDWKAGSGKEWEDVARHYKRLRVKPAMYALPQKPQQDIRNVAVTGLRTRYPLLDVHRKGTFVVELTNYCDEEKKVEMIFFADGRELERRQITAGTGVNSENFEHRFEKPGSHAVKVVVREDDLTADNAMTMAVEVLRSIPVLVVEGVFEDSRFVSPGTMLEWALEAGGREEGEHLFEVTRIDETELGDLAYADLIRYRSLMLVNVRSMPADFAGLLKQYVREGGGLLINGGSHTRAGHYNRLYKGDEGLLPAKIAQTRKSKSKPWQPSFPAGPASEILGFSKVSRTRTLEEVNVNRFIELDPAPGAGIIGLLKDKPFLVVKEHGEGSVALCSVAFSLDWSNLPAVPDFVPLIQNLAFHLSSRIIPPVNISQGETLVYSYSRTKRSYTVNDTNAPADPGDVQSCEVVTPDGTTNKVDLLNRMGESIGYFGETMHPGLYRARVGNGPVRYYAVNLPSGEGNLAPVGPREKKILADQADIGFADNMAELRRAIRRETVGTDLCSPLIVATLLALVADSLLASRCSGRTARRTGEEQ